VVYGAKACHAAIATPGAAALILTLKNAQTWKGSGAGVEARHETLRSARHLGRTIWKKWSGYHRRSLVETKMGCFKLLGERVTAKDFDRQMIGLQVRAVILNQLMRLGTPKGGRELTAAVPEAFADLGLWQRVQPSVDIWLYDQ